MLIFVLVCFIIIIMLALYSSMFLQCKSNIICSTLLKQKHLTIKVQINMILIELNPIETILAMQIS